MREDAIVAYHVGHCTVAEGYGWCGGQGGIHWYVVPLGRKALPKQTTDGQQTLKAHSDPKESLKLQSVSVSTPRPVRPCIPFSQPSVLFALTFSAQENITYARAVNSEHQLELLNKVAEFFVSNEYRLLIVDSIMALFRVDYVGRGELNERQQKLNQFLSKLTHVAEGMAENLFCITCPPPLVPWLIPKLTFRSTIEFNVAVLMTNQVQSDPGASALFAGADGRKPVGGHILAHASATRILLRKGRGEERVAKIQDSPGKSSSPSWLGGGGREEMCADMRADMPEKEATYIITNGGINDPEKV